MSLVEKKRKGYIIQRRVFASATFQSQNAHPTRSPKRCEDISQIFRHGAHRHSPDQVIGGYRISEFLQFNDYTPFLVNIFGTTPGILVE